MDAENLRLIVFYSVDVYIIQFRALDSDVLSPSSIRNNKS